MVVFVSCDFVVVGVYDGGGLWVVDDGFFVFGLWLEGDFFGYDLQVCVEVVGGGVGVGFEGVEVQFVVGGCDQVVGVGWFVWMFGEGEGVVVGDVVVVGYGGVDLVGGFEGVDVQFCLVFGFCFGGVVGVGEFVFGQVGVYVVVGVVVDFQWCGGLWFGMFDGLYCLVFYGGGGCVEVVVVMYEGQWFDCVDVLLFQDQVVVFLVVCFGCGLVQCGFGQWFMGVGGIVQYYCVLVFFVFEVVIDVFFFYQLVDEFEVCFVVLYVEVVFVVGGGECGVVVLGCGVVVEDGFEDFFYVFVLEDVVVG